MLVNAGALLVPPLTSLRHPYVAVLALNLPPETDWTAGIVFHPAAVIGGCIATECVVRKDRAAVIVIYSAAVWSRIATEGNACQRRIAACAGSVEHATLVLVALWPLDVRLLTCRRSASIGRLYWK